MRLDARTKMLNPKWYEGMLSSGYEGVREIEKRLTNTMGWSATSGQVSTESKYFIIYWISCGAEELAFASSSLSITHNVATHG